jgi:hypothetical protein
VTDDELAGGFYGRVEGRPVSVNYKLSIWYRATPEDGEPQVQILSAEQVADYIRPEVGMLHDMLELKGSGVRKLTLEVINPKVRIKP